MEGSLATVVAPDADAFAAAKARRSAVEAALSAAAGRSMRAEIRLVDRGGAVSGTAATDERGGVPADDPMNHPVVRRAVELFGARVVEVRDDDGE